MADDVDDSGTLNSNAELRQLVLALVSKLGLTVHGDDTLQRLQTAGTLSDSNAWGLEEFSAWFHKVSPLPSFILPSSTRLVQMSI